MVVYLQIDPELLDKVVCIGCENTKKATVERALREFIESREQKRILDLFGKLELNEGAVDC